MFPGGKKKSRDPLAIALSEAEDVRDAAALGESWTAVANANTQIAKIRALMEDRKAEAERAARPAPPVAAPVVDAEAEYLARQVAELEDDLEAMREKMRRGAAVTTAVTALRRQLGEAREAVAAHAVRTGTKFSPAERMERARDLATRAPDALLEVYVVEWLARRRIPLASVAALIEGRE